MKRSCDERVARHPSESWDPLDLTVDAMDPSFRWDDGKTGRSSSASPARMGQYAAREFPGRRRHPTDSMTTPSRRDLANAIRFLAVDAVEAANSGHPGMPMGMADIAEVLWNDYLSHNPNNPKWFNRDRFVLSNGHGSMLQYALLHLSRLRPADRRAEALPPARIEDAGPSGKLHDARRGDDDRPARPGLRQRRRHGARRESCSRSASTAPATTIVDHRT